MSLRESLDPRSSLWDLFAYYLHFLRVKHVLSCSDVGKITNAARQTVSHWEAKRLKPAEDQVDALDKEYETGGLLSILLHHAKTGHSSDWFQAHLDLEARASMLSIYELALVPGLLQTEEYARALFMDAKIKGLEGRLSERMRRQHILEKEDPPVLWILLAEPVIEWHVGGCQVMHEQLARLLELSHLQNVILRLVPKAGGAHIGLRGAFKIMEVAGASVAYTEAMGGGRLIQDASEVAAFRMWYDLIGATALPVDSSRKRLEQAMEAYR